MEGGKRVYEMGFCNCWELPVGSGVEATRSPGYGKWLQRERRMVSKGVGARIHRQACVAGGDTVFILFFILCRILRSCNRQKGMVQLLGLHRWLEGWSEVMEKFR